MPGLPNPASQDAYLVNDASITLDVAHRRIGALKASMCTWRVVLCSPRSGRVGVLSGIAASLEAPFHPGPRSIGAGLYFARRLWALPCLCS